ncbi:MAG: carboxypeptidase-like regulatory domain-containing protein [Thermoplasmata archaeon]
MTVALSLDRGTTSMNGRGVGTPDPADGASRPGRIRLGFSRRPGRAGILAIAVLVVALMAVQSVATVVSDSSTSLSAASGAPTGPGAATPTANSSFPGESTAGELPINPALVGQSAAVRIAAPARLVNGTVTALPRPGSPTPPGASDAAASAEITVASAAGPGLNYGYLTGTVVDSRSPHDPISGATVSAEPLVGFCPSVGCLPNQTGANGQFKIAAGVGENELLIEDSYYMTNRTWAYVSVGSYVSVGTIELVADGFVTGKLEGSDPSHEPVPAINISAETRDGAFLASPSAHSNSLGVFTVAVPPVPSEVSFTPIYPGSPYRTNYTFVNVSAGETLNVGTIYLQRSTVVSVRLDDSIGGGFLNGVEASLTVCSKLTGFCENAGPSSGDGILTAAAPVGPDIATVQANDFVENTTSLGWVPAVRVGSAPVPMGDVDVVPTGVIQVTPDISGIPASTYNSEPPSSVWNIPDDEPSVYVTACDLDGLSASVYNPLTQNLSSSQCTSGCSPPGTAVQILGVPLRNYVNVEPATEEQCNPYDPLWPIPGEMPVFANYAWANVTPGYVTDMGALDLLPGTYIEGQVLPATSVGWNALACSTDEPAICGETAYADSSYYADYYNELPNDCPALGEPNAGTTFCVAAPPGPVKVQITSPNASSNYTWADVTPLTWSALPLPLSTASLGRVQSINLTTAEVTGRVLQARSDTPVAGLPAVEVCPAGTPSAAVSCESGVPNTTGFFKTWAPPGWDRVTVSAPDYVANGTYLYVARTNSTGTILVTPYGYIQGQVVDPEGNGIVEATVQLCPVTNPGSCASIGSDGLASTDGFYYGAAPAGSLPKGSYQIVASAPGFSTDWTWVNVTTPGENFTAPTITLVPLAGAGVGAGPRDSSAPTVPEATIALDAPLGAWINGTVVDAQRGAPLTTAAITAYPLSGAIQTVISSIRGTGGEFNDSLPVGAYTIGFTDPGFYPTSIFLNVSGNSTDLSLGTITLVPYPTITGRLVIQPENWTQGVTEQMGLGPGISQVQVCTTLATECGPTTAADSGGDFNTSAPAGTYDTVYASGTGTGPGTVTGGFDSNQTEVNVTNDSGQDRAGILVGMPIFAVITGTVLDASTPGAAPVRFDSITAGSTAPIGQTQGEVFNADGLFAIIFPESDQLNMTVGGLGAWVPINVTIPTQLVSSGGHPQVYLGPGEVLSLGPLFSLEHFGWIDAQVTNAVTGAPVPYATLSAGELFYLWGTPVALQASGVANGAGFVNVSAPPGLAPGETVSVNISAPDASYLTTAVPVNSSRTTFLNGTSALNLRGERLLPWGWISGTVTDAVSGAPLQAVAVAVTDANLQSGASGVSTDGRGAYLTDAPVSPSDSVSLTLAGYSSNLSRYNVTYGAWVVASPVHLTGDGIVEGRVFSEPDATYVAGATVSVCPKAQPNCPNQVTTNASGFYTITASPGVNSVVVSAPGFVSNVPQYVLVTSDSWTWAGVVTVYEYAHVAGVVVGLPDGLPLDGANASLCGLPTSGPGAGPCFSTVVTPVDGSFDVAAPAGVYVLEVNATFYNDSYLTVAVAAGGTLSVGTIFVQEYGTAAGSVDSSVTDAPIASATVNACENWDVGVCTVPIVTGADGQYLVSGPPGPYTFEATAPGFQTGFAVVDLSSALTVQVPAFLLVPSGPGGLFPVSGTVDSAGSPPSPLAGAVVTASGVYSAPVGATGNFSFLLPWGTYTLTASLTGFVSSTETEVVHTAVSGVSFLLATRTYSVTGVVTDGLTGQPLANVQIEENGDPVGNATAASGAFSLQLAHGVHSLVAEPPAGSGDYVAVPFQVDVSDGAVVHDLALYPPEVTVEGTVASSLSGSPLDGAAVTVSGMTSENVPWTTTAVSGPNGRFVALAYPGSYDVRVSDPGFTASSVALQLNGTASVPVTVDLAPISSASAPGTSSAAALYVAAGIVAAGVLTVGLLLWTRRPPSSRSRRSPPSGAPGTGGNAG